MEQLLDTDSFGDITSPVSGTEGANQEAPALTETVVLDNPDLVVQEVTVAPDNAENAPCEPMMESVLISDSPNNSEDEVTLNPSEITGAESQQTCTPTDVAQAGADDCSLKEHQANSLKVLDDQEADVSTDASPELEGLEPAEGGSQVDVRVEPAGRDFTDVLTTDDVPGSLGEERKINEDPLPICTIFNKGAKGKMAGPGKEEGFQSQMIKSPSCSGSLEVQSSSPPIHPSPSLSKFFAEDSSAPATGADFFDSFTSTSFSSVSNSNARSGPSEEHGLRAEDVAAPLQATFSFGCPVLDDPSPTLDNPDSPKPVAVFGGDDDLFATVLNSNDYDRRHDSWLPSEETRRLLIAIATKSFGSVFVEKERLAMPGLKAEVPQVNAVKALVSQFVSEQKAGQMQTLTASSVEQSISGLRQLIATDNWTAAAELVGRMLTAHGQGYNKCGHPTSHTSDSLQLWFVRLALLVKLQQYSDAESEFEPFGNLDFPDLYYEYYPEMYPGRQGSMIPFAMRLLHAELPQHQGRSHDSLNRLHHLQNVCRQILSNLENGFAEDGSMKNISSESHKASIVLWKSRLARVLHSLGNCLLLLKDYCLAVDMFEAVIDLQPHLELPIVSGIGRILLQVGDISAAEEYFARVERVSQDEDGLEYKITVLVNRAFLHLAKNNFLEAYNWFMEVLKRDPSNAVASNNCAVCLLYLGKLKEALTHLEGFFEREPAMYQHESVLFNLSTMYELESSRSLAKKEALLLSVSRRAGDNFNAQCLKMQ
uniref:trafficking protein particle complex subunit 12 isoform X2 n=1 Tax=Myxine glutinosa TaxID=7769 RepID=UPI00358FF9C7